MSDRDLVLFLFGFHTKTFGRPITHDANGRPVADSTRVRVRPDLPGLGRVGPWALDLHRPFPAEGVEAVDDCWVVWRIERVETGLRMTTLHLPTPLRPDRTLRERLVRWVGRWICKRGR